MFVCTALYLPITVMTFRIVLIAVGVLKGPVFRSSEKYGDREDFFQLLPQALFWGGLWFSATGVAVRLVGDVPIYATELLGTVLIVLSGVAFVFPQIGLRYFRFPVWYFELKERTTRYERRRIAYMWRRLPLNLRLIYSSNHRAFQDWSDMVILGTIF
jgi:hypothetical protein